MPRGWYRTQEKGPCELPDGRLVCGPHGCVICYKCGVDYSFRDEDSDYDDDYGNNPPGFDAGPMFSMSTFDPLEFESASGLELRRGTGQVFPTKFSPPSNYITPDALFSRRVTDKSVKRYTLHNDASTTLIRTNSACLHNGQRNPAAGWGFWHGISPAGDELTASARLEKRGPFGDDALQTSNRAELRAVIGALRFQFWPDKGFNRLVIATDSEYVVEGSTGWARGWVRNGWWTRVGPVKNKDLWEALLGEVERYDEEGMAVEFWRIPREWNTVADAAAKDAAAERYVPDRWTEVVGLDL